MLNVSLKAVEKLKDILLERCVNNGLGFRLQSLSPDAETNGFVIRLDRMGPGDEVVVNQGIIIFVANNGLRSLEGGELDYCEEPGLGFWVRKTDESLNSKEKKEEVQS